MKRLRGRRSTTFKGVKLRPFVDTSGPNTRQRKRAADRATAKQVRRLVKQQKRKVKRQTNGR